VKRAAILLSLALFACTRVPHRALQAAAAPRVIFVGLDGADWQLLDQYCADGTMPNLGALVRTGEKRVLLTQHPPLSPLVWTTMMTGVSPLEHRILDFARFNPTTRQLEPITSDERAVPAIWNIATSAKKNVGVFGMWATDPPEPGIVASQAAMRSTATDVWQRTVEETETTHRLARDWIAKNRPHLAIVYFEGTDIAGHLFAQRGSPIPQQYFARIDQILGDYRDLAKQLDATLVIASDHGFDWRSKRPPETSKNTATAAKWHRDEGIFLRWSPHRRVLPTIAPSAIRVDAVCTMLLQLLKVAPKPLSPPRAATVAAARVSGASEEIAKLKSLGYISSNEPSVGPNGTSTRTSGSFNNEGVILRERGRPDEALRAFENALRVDGKNASAMWNLSELLHHLRRDETRAAALLDEAIALDSNQPRWLLARGSRALQRHDCRKALDDFKRATDLAPESALAFASLGAAEACSGHEKAAQEAFRRSLALDPNQPELRRLSSRM
jgi:tetratricopeptide (TPR) repeat protein